MQQKEKKAAVLTLQVKSFSELVKKMETPEVFCYVNQILEQLVPAVLEYEGTIDQYLGAGLLACYPAKPQNALRTALAICERMQGKEWCSAGLCYGKIITGSIGSGDRVSDVTISEYTGMSEFLQGIAAKYHAHILVTASYAGQIEHFEERYTYRLLGYVKIRTLDSIEKIYDVFSADEQEDVWLKKKTRLMFEEGVRLYTGRKLAMARRHFIEVLKNYREDAAAREYLYLCDYYMMRENAEQFQVCIESYG